MIRLMKNLFTEHPATVGESYLEHMRSASSFAGSMFVASICCLIHGFLPFLFTTKGKDTISELHTRMVTHRADEKFRREGAAQSGHVIQ